MHPQCTQFLRENVSHSCTFFQQTTGDYMNVILIFLLPFRFLTNVDINVFSWTSRPRAQKFLHCFAASFTCSQLAHQLLKRMNPPSAFFERSTLDSAVLLSLAYVDLGETLEQPLKSQIIFRFFYTGYL